MSHFIFRSRSAAVCSRPSLATWYFSSFHLAFFSFLVCDIARSTLVTVRISSQQLHLTVLDLTLDFSFSLFHLELSRVLYDFHLWSASASRLLLSQFLQQYFAIILVSQTDSLTWAHHYSKLQEGTTWSLQAIKFSNARSFTLASTCARFTSVSTCVGFLLSICSLRLVYTPTYLHLTQMCNCT